jgi:hypothetical protein
MSFNGYIKEKLWFTEELAVLLLCLIPAVFIVFYALSYYANSNALFYIGIGICGVLAIFPVKMLLAAFLLIFFPGTFKEYGMKQRRKKKLREIKQGKQQ